MIPGVSREGCRCARNEPGSKRILPGGDRNPNREAQDEEHWNRDDHEALHIKRQTKIDAINHAGRKIARSKDAGRD